MLLQRSRARDRVARALADRSPRLRTAPALHGKKSRAVALGRAARRRRERGGASRPGGTPVARLAFRGFHRKVSSFRANSPPGLANAAAALCRVAAPGPRRPRRGTGTDKPQQPPPRAAASARPDAGSPRLAPRRGPRPRRAGRPRPPAPPRGPRRRARPAAARRRRARTRAGRPLAPTAARARPAGDPLARPGRAAPSRLHTQVRRRRRRRGR